MEHYCFPLAAALGVVACLGLADTASARDQVRMAGSSTVLPYAKIVAEQFGKTFKSFKPPLVESGGTGAGFKEFCGGVGEATVDIANASRPMRKDEAAACEKAGVKGIIEAKFGYDGIVFASDVKGPTFAFTAKDWYYALAAEIPDAGGRAAPNPRKTWKQVNPSFPDWTIVAYIPGEQHGTREVFEEKVLLAGCRSSGARDAMIRSGMDAARADTACTRVRKDGAAVDIDGDYTDTLARLESNKQGIGVFGLTFYENNTLKLKVATVDNIVPSVEAIAAGKYPVSRPLFFYVKKAHIGTIPGLKEYAEFFVSDPMIGPRGPLANHGLVPLPDRERAKVQEMLKGRFM
jgi:phosphate transport system substrate-binding protein